MAPFGIVFFFFLDQSNCKDLESLFAWSQTNKDPGAGASICISQLSSGLESTLSLSTKDPSLHLPGWSGNTEGPPARAEKSEAKWSRVAREAASQLCCVTVELSAPNKASFFPTL